MHTNFPCLPLIQERFYNAVKTQFPKELKYPTYDIQMFSQVWGSTALGFGGFGGQAMTKAYTTIIKEENTNLYGVFFGDRMAYVIENPTKEFFEDIQEHNMKAMDEITPYIRNRKVFFR